MLAAFNAVQAQLEGGATTVTAQPWIENQVTAGAGIASCQAAIGVSCTQYVANNFGTLIEEGGTADTVQQLFANGLLRPNVGLSSQFGTNAYVTNLSASSYNGMLVSLRRRFSQGLQFDVNYTWSHAIDNQSTVANTTAGSGGLVCDVTNLRVCRGNADFDIRHLLNVNGIWEIPVGRGRFFAGDAPGWLNAIIGGWQVSGIFTARSGLPFGIDSNSWPRTFIYNPNGVPAVITGDASALRMQIQDAPGGTIQFFADPEAALAAVRYPRHGEIGNRNALRGPSFWNLDTNVMKNFNLPWSETQRLQIRWESYNALNHHSYGLPSVALGTTTYGQITTSASTARVMQFGVRWDF
jgi:hypothetical protein